MMSLCSYSAKEWLGLQCTLGQHENREERCMLKETW